MFITVLITTRDWAVSWTTWVLSKLGLPELPLTKYIATTTCYLLFGISKLGLEYGLVVQSCNDGAIQTHVQISNNYLRPV